MKSKKNLSINAAIAATIMMTASINPVKSAAGSVVKIIPLDAKSKSGSITLYAADLAKGINHYSLTANGVVLEKKQMINP